MKGISASGSSNGLGGAPGFQGDWLSWDQEEILAEWKAGRDFGRVEVRKGRGAPNGCPSPLFIGLRVQLTRISDNSRG
ncbi:hypothetical protein ACLOJK_008024 [Asimina triloba]